MCMFHKLNIDPPHFEYCDPKINDVFSGTPKERKELPKSQGRQRLVQIDAAVGY